ncbi:MAG: hypothetical protein WCY30_01645 [Candidatus Neomarinimicrobiota bacterium]|jgi:hypothetical protein
MGQSTEKFGVSAEDILCKYCKGIGCQHCGMTGRKTGEINPQKEAKAFEKERANYERGKEAK